LIETINHLFDKYLIYDKKTKVPLVFCSDFTAESTKICYYLFICRSIETVSIIKTPKIFFIKYLCLFSYRYDID
jgi:hypothetical protein